MIEFHLDGHSKVVTYLQLVQQVKQSLRLGLIDPGDQLPRVREVAEALAINPNTVLKAYRQLEPEHLVVARPGVGTFVMRSLAGPALANQAALRHELIGWLSRARTAGLDQEDVVALVETTMRATFQEGLDGGADEGVDSMSTALETRGLGKRYGRNWALRECSLAVPAGRVAGLVGPNGAGKTTLLHLAVGLLRPDAGSVRVLGDTPETGPPRIGFVAQDAPLYRDFHAADLITMGQKLNKRWDSGFARDRLTQLRIPLDRKVGKLSGGQRAQVALALALARKPDLLLLDEPVASLDPLARREFLQVLMGGVAEHGTTVLLSSHLVADLERVCDYLIVLNESRVQVLGGVEDLLATHKVLVGPRRADRVGPVASRP